MARTITYWVTTILIAAMSAFAGFSYLTGSQQVVEGFAHVGYPQQLRGILGVAKLLGAIALVCSWLPEGQGVGLRGLHFRMDLGVYCTLFG